VSRCPHASSGKNRSRIVLPGAHPDRCARGYRFAEKHSADEEQLPLESAPHPELPAIHLMVIAFVIGVVWLSIIYPSPPGYFVTLMGKYNISPRAGPHHVVEACTPYLIWGSLDSRNPGHCAQLRDGCARS